MRRVRAVGAAVLCAAVCGCGDSHAEEVCHEMADLVARAFVNCKQGTYDQNKATFESGLGGCDNVKAIRDENALRSECYPFLKNEKDCTRIGDPTSWPESCKQQLLLKSAQPAPSPADGGTQPGSD